MLVASANFPNTAEAMPARFKGPASQSAWRQPLDAGILELLVADQREISGDAILGDKALEQRCGKLNFLAIGAFNQHLPHRAAIIIQVLFGRYAEPKFVAVHGHHF